jgi:hypothetical protein
MTRARLSLDEAKTLPYDQLLARAYALLEPYEMKQDMETPTELEHRISKTLDEAPDVYAWLLQLHAWFSYWADFFYGQDRGGTQYKEYKNKRDLFEKAASACKMRYEGTSRRLTQLQRHDEESRMPRTR